MIEQAFEVATEFRFDIGSALINTKALTGAVDNLSNAASNAQNQLSYLAGGLVAHLGLGSGGIISALRRAVDVSEEFQTGMFGFMNSIDSNMQVLSGTINTFNDRLETSKMLMGNVNSEANRFGLSSKDLAQITGLVASPLAARGRAGTNYKGAISMARNMMLTSEAVGLPQTMGAEMLARGLTTGAIGGKLFERLANTPAFRAQHIMRSEQLSPMRMNDTRRIDLLTKALEQLGGNAEWLALRAKSLGFQFQLLKNRVDQLLRPIGDAIKAPIIMLFQKLNNWLQTYGPALGEALGKLITQFTADPKALITGLMQISHLKQDLKRAFEFAGLFQTLRFVIPILKSMGLINGGLLYGMFFALGRGLRYIWLVLSSPLFLGALRLIGSAIRAFLPEFLLFAAIFQSISRAKAKAKINDAEKGVDIGAKFLVVFQRISKYISVIFSPITYLMDALAEFISPLFRISTYASWALSAMTLLADFLKTFANVVLGISGQIIAVNAGLTESTRLKVIAQGPKAMEKTFETAYGARLSLFEKQHPFLNGQEAPTAKSVVYNTNHIEARFDMREQLEPDRVAFAVTTHLKKLTLSAIGARGHAIDSGFAGNN
jgi:hypothetical protein